MVGGTRFIVPASPPNLPVDELAGPLLRAALAGSDAWDHYVQGANYDDFCRRSLMANFPIIDVSISYFLIFITYVLLFLDLFLLFCRSTALMVVMLLLFQTLFLHGIGLQRSWALTALIKRYRFHVLRTAFLRFLNRSVPFLWTMCRRGMS